MKKKYPKMMSTSVPTFGNFGFEKTADNFYVDYRRAMDLFPLCYDQANY
jgi:hypothetical protein